jgi:hypothetical protein
MRAIAALGVLLASTAHALSPCTYAEVVPNRYTSSADPFAGWGSLPGVTGPIDSAGAVEVQAVSTGVSYVGAVYVDRGAGAVTLTAIERSALNRTGADASMVTAAFWTLPSHTVQASSSVSGLVTGLGETDTIVTSPEAPGGLVGIFKADLSSISPGLNGSGFVPVDCSLQSLTLWTCEVRAAPVVCPSWGTVHSVAVSAQSSAGVPSRLWAATDLGLAVINGSTCSWAISSPSVTGGLPVTAVTIAPANFAADLVLDVGDGVAASSSSFKVVAAGSWRLWVLDEATLEVLHWEWVSNVTSGQGGAVSAPVAALATDWATSTVYVGTATALDALYSNVSLQRIDGYSGLPYANITSLSIASFGKLPLCPGGASLCSNWDRPSTTWLLIGSDAGMSIADITPTSTPSKRLRGATVADPLPVSQWSWRYMYLDRWLPAARVSSVASFNTNPITSSGSLPPVFFATAQPWTIAPTREHAQHGSTPYGKVGLSVFEVQPWTLEAKAARMRTIQARHNRHGMVSDCPLTTPGDVLSCANGPSDNNGLWTSLVSSAYALEFGVTGSPRALNDSLTFLAGLKLLNDVTGIHGLMGRSCIAPGESRPPGGTWYNSSVPEFAGWQWKGDTSSDEVTGHEFGFSVALALLDLRTTPGGWTSGLIAQYLVDITSYIVSNNFHLIDADGEPTRWGDWSPHTMNANDSWSDGRGVNSLQILAYLRASFAAAPLVSGGGAAQQAMFTQAWVTLTNATNRYLGHLRNLKIEAPSDDNYSDDELTALPFYTWLVATPLLAGGDPTPASLVAPCLAGVNRWYRAVSSLRSDLWMATTVAVDASRASQGGVPLLDRTQAAVDARWNLETWPLELIDWNVQNSHRNDVYFYQYVNREGQYGLDSVRVLPANERIQDRWNGNPHDLDSWGNAGSETDGGVWLLPYWMGRYHGMVA